MILDKWNYEKHVYEPYAVPDDWKVSKYEDNLNAVVNCCQCGRKVIVDDTFSSHEIHDDLGLGFMVCSDCHDKEWKRRKKYKREE